MTHNKNAIFTLAAVARLCDVPIPRFTSWIRSGTIPAPDLTGLGVNCYSPERANEIAKLVADRNSLMTQNEAAARLKMSANALRYAAHFGQYPKPSHQWGNSIRKYYRREEIEQLASKTKGRK